MFFVQNFVLYLIVYSVLACAAWFSISALISPATWLAVSELMQFCVKRPILVFVLLVVFFSSFTVAYKNRYNQVVFIKNTQP